MAEETKQVDKVDHRAEARQLLHDAATTSEEDSLTLVNLQEAQVHASLAIAEQLERLNEMLEKGAIEVVYGGSTINGLRLGTPDA